MGDLGRKVGVAANLPELVRLHREVVLDVLAALAHGEAVAGDDGRRVNLVPHLEV